MKKVTAAFQGEHGAFSELAALALLGRSVSTVPCNTFAALFSKVEEGKADHGVVPIENSLVGSIHQNYDLLLERKLSVTGETYVRITHSLIAPKGTSLSQIKRVYSHPVALDQCRTFFATNKTIAPIPFYDTAGAVKMIAESGTKNAAAIAGPHSAALYGFATIKNKLEDFPHNYTRFLLLARKPVTVSGKAKTSIVFAVKNEPGILFKMLSVFALRDIDLTRIESRPARHKAWEYYFYLDFFGSPKDAPVARALDHLGELTHFVRLLGTYKAATIPTGKA